MTMGNAIPSANSVDSREASPAARWFCSRRDRPPMTIGKRILMRMFGRPKGSLGRLGGIIMARTNRKVASWAIDLLDVQPSDQILEVGFGPGVGIQLLAKSAWSGRVVGVDHSEEMVEQATVRNAKAIEAGRVDLREGSVERLPFEDATFDSVLAVNSMQVWPDAGAGLREIRRVMKPVAGLRSRSPGILDSRRAG